MFFNDIDIPKSWRELNLDQLNGVVMIIGGSNTGKTTFTKYLYALMIEIGRNVAYLDGDPGQSTLGPPTTMTILHGFTTNETDFKRIVRRKFIGSISPKGHMLQTLVGAKHLVETAKVNGTNLILYDTTGLVDPLQGGLALKIAKIDLLRPKTIIAFQRNGELNQLLYPLQRKKQINIAVFEPSHHTLIRDKIARQEYRKRKFREYFNNAREIELDWTNISVLPAPRFTINRLIAIEDRMGFVDGLGIITSISRDKKYLSLISPELYSEHIKAIRLGDILVNPITFEDRYI